MSPKIEIQRKNCINGKWSLKDRATNEERHVDFATLVEHYISQTEERGVSTDDLASLNMNFTPTKPEDANGHGVNGVLTINYIISKR